MVLFLAQGRSKIRFAAHALEYLECGPLVKFGAFQGGAAMSSQDGLFVGSCGKIAGRMDGDDRTGHFRNAMRKQMRGCRPIGGSHRRGGRSGLGRLKGCKRIDQLGAILSSLFEGGPYALMHRRPPSSLQFHLFLRRRRSTTTKRTARLWYRRPEYPVLRVVFQSHLARLALPQFPVVVRYPNCCYFGLPSLSLRET